MARKRLPSEILEWFRKQGSKGGKLGGSAGGKRSLETMTAEERSERARKAVAAREAKRAGSPKAKPAARKPREGK